jgi:hypothetical protein
MRKIRTSAMTQSSGVKGRVTDWGGAIIVLNQHLAVLAGVLKHFMLCVHCQDFCHDSELR